MRLDSYIRVSRVGGREGASFISPDVQRDQIGRWAQAHNIQISVEHVDLDQSGAKTNRPGFQAMLARVGTHQTGGVVVAKLDRFGRSLIDALAAIRRIDEAGGKFVSVAEQFDTSTPTGKLVLRIMLTLAEFELDRITETWRITQARAIGRGVHFSTPFGYQRSDDGTLEPDANAALVVEVFSRRAGRESWTDIARWLNTKVPSPTGQEWTPRTVAHIIRRRTYLGEAKHGEHVNPAAHPAIVSQENFQAAQGVPGIPGRRGTSLLSGVIRCAGCRHNMKPDRFGPAGNLTRVYRCRGHHAAGKCPAPATVTMRLVDEHVEREFLERYRDETVQLTVQSQSLEDSRQQLVEAETELAAFRDDLRIREAIGHEHFLTGLKVRADALTEAQTRLEQERAASRVADLPNMLAVWDGLTTPERREVIAAGIDCVFLRRIGQAPITERAVILWAGEGPDDLPGPHRIVTLRSFQGLDEVARETG